MRNGHRANALLVELLLVIFFFMIASVTLVQLFGAAKLKSTAAKAMTSAMLETQNIADELYASADADETLRELGFRAENDGWTRDDDQYVIRITRTDAKTDGGTLVTYEVEASLGEETLITLPSARYMPEEVSP